MRTISGRLKTMGMVRPLGCVRLNAALSLLTLWRLWRSRSLLRNSTVPPAGTIITRGTNTHCFSSIWTGGAAGFTAVAGDHDELLGVLLGPADGMIDGDVELLRLGLSASEAHGAPQGAAPDRAR